MIPTISTHTLTWSVTRVENQQWQRNVHFNSHAHVERDNGLTRAWLMNIISTHTLTWSVTRGCVDLTRAMRRISTHTLTWSVT